MNTNEGFTPGLSPEEQKEQYEAELLADYFARCPEPVIAPEDIREAGPEIAEFEGLIASFESTHSLAELHAITDLTPKEAPMHPVREPAKEALVPITDMLNKLKRETNITPEKHEELKSEYRRLSRAVGMINGGKVDHNR